MNDPSFAVFEKGIKALYAKRWEAAAKLFEKVVADTDQRDLAERSRRFLAICERNLRGGSAQQADDPFLLAVFEKNRGNFDEALAMCSRRGRQSKDERFAFLAASIWSLQGDFDKAVGLLETAIEHNPKNRVLAYFDSDFDELRESPDHTHIFD
jgi:tetratricopeptide (TPR) repeat protein